MSPGEDLKKKTLEKLLACILHTDDYSLSHELLQGMGWGFGARVLSRDPVGAQGKFVGWTDGWIKGWMDDGCTGPGFDFLGLGPRLRQGLIRQ